MFRFSKKFLLATPSIFRRFNLRSFTEKDNADTKNKDQNASSNKDVKHIYKQKKTEDGQEIIYDEAHTFNEGYDDGYYVRERTSFVYYEVPGTGRSAESGGKSDIRDSKSEQVNKDNKQTKETLKETAEETTKENSKKNASENTKENSKEIPKETLKENAEENKKI